MALQTGINVTYYPGIASFDNPQAHSVVQHISVANGMVDGQPDELFASADYFTARFEGYIQGDFTGVRSFVLKHNDSARVTINGEVMQVRSNGDPEVNWPADFRWNGVDLYFDNEWADFNTTWTFNYPIVEDEFYHIVVDYTKANLVANNAHIELLWEVSPGSGLVITEVPFIVSVCDHTTGRAISPELEAYWAQESADRANLWLIVPENGRATEGYTDWDSDLMYDDGQGPVLYRSRGSLALSQTPVNAGLETNATDARTLLHLDGASRAKIEAGLYQDARYRTLAVNPHDLTMGHVILSGGRLGKPTIGDSDATFELLSWAALSNRSIGRIFQARCPYRFLYGHCRNNVGTLSLDDGPKPADHTGTGTVLEVISATELIVEGIDKADKWASDGVLRFEGGEFDKAEFDVMESAQIGGSNQQHLWLEQPLPFVPAVGQPIALEEGCDHSFDGPRGCVTKPNTMQSSNAVNFGGQPYAGGTSTFAIQD